MIFFSIIFAVKTNLVSKTYLMFLNGQKGSFSYANCMNKTMCGALAIKNKTPNLQTIYVIPVAEAIIKLALVYLLTVMKTLFVVDANKRMYLKNN